MGKIDKVSPATLRELAKQLNVSDKEVISLKAGDCLLELKILLSDFNFQATLGNIRPNLNDFGSDVLEATKILRDHESIMAKLNSVQNDFMSALDFNNENIFEWKNLLDAAFTDLKEKLDHKKHKLVKRIRTEYIENQNDNSGPKIVKPFRDKSQKFGLPCTFEADIFADPEPKITWLFNDGHLVVDQSNMTTARNGSTYSLNISNVGPQHLGKYTLVGRNTRGEASCSAFLDHVSNHPTPRSFLSPATTSYSSASLASDGKRESLSSPDSPGNNRVLKSVPKFISKLTNKESYEGDSIRFEVRVCGNPEPEVRWFREGVEIINSPDFKISKNDSFPDLHFLEIPEIFQEDSGRFTCIVHNSQGSEQCSANLVVHASSDFTSLSGHGSDLSLEELKVILPPNLDSFSGSLSNLVHIRTSTPPMDGEQCMKPYFRAISKDLEVGEGKGARFDAIVAGKPNPEVVWVKDGRRLTTDRNYCVVVNEKGINSLIIRATTLGDAGSYQCVASNKAGQDWFKVTLTVLPKWSSGRYSPTNSMTHVTRVSPPSTYKTVSSIARTFHSEERTHHRTTHSRQFHSEERRALRKNFYKAASPRKSPSNDEMTSFRASVRRTLRGPMIYNKNITCTSNPTAAPQLIEPIVEPEVREGETATLSCRIFCEGPCNFQWFFNNQLLPQRPDKYEVLVDGDKYILKIQSVSASDRGFYQCTVSNDDGEVACIGRLNPGTRMCRLARSPLPSGLRSPAPSPQNFHRIEEVKLSCTVVGDPKPTLTWFVDDRVIDDQATSDMKIYYDESTGLAELAIRNVAKYLNSTIRCVAENSHGRAETQCILSEATLNDPLITDANYTNVLIHQLTEERNFSTLKTGPRFSHRAQPCVAQEGQTVTLTATVHGRPRPIVTWTKDDGKELEPSDKYSIVFDDKKNICKLLIHNCTVEDSGEYSCVAFNPTGQTTCSATIYIYPPQDGMTVNVPLSKTEKTPSFQKTLQPKTEIIAGEPIKFQCKILREPCMKVTWYFNGVEISSGHNMKEVDGNIISSLFIPDPRAANTGEYTCKARNMNGESRTTTYLFVKEDESIRTTSSPHPVFCMPILQTHSEAAPLDKDSNSYNTPPTFSLSLVNRVVTEGSEVFFVVRFEGEPLPSIQWFANGNPVTEKTSDCKILTDFNKKESILYIKEVFIGDEGEYTCKAENISGVAYATSHLYIKVPRETEGDYEASHEIKKFIDLEGKPRFSVELTLMPDYVPSRSHSVTKQVYIDNVRSPVLINNEFEVDDLSEVRRFEVERQLQERTEQPFSETISIDRSDQSVKTLEFEVIHQKSPINTEIYFQSQGDSRTSMVSEMESEFVKLPMFSETVSIDSRDSVRKIIPLISPPEIISQEDSEIRRLTVESEYELKPEPQFSETVAIDTTKIQEVVFEALPSNQTSEITIHQDASLKGIKMEAEIILVEEKPQIFSETVMIDKTDSREIILEKPDSKKTSEITVHQESTLQGIKMEAEVILEEQKFSETVSIDKTFDATHMLEFTMPKETKTSELTVHKQSMPRGIKVEAEILPEKNLKSELIVETGHAPTFLVELVPTTVMDGSPVEFTTKLIGRPMPKKVTWYRNDRNCDDIVHIITDYDESTGVSHLQIAEVFPEDGGHYTCVATNIHGTAKTTAVLTVAAFDQLDVSSDESVEILSDVDELGPLPVNVRDSDMSLADAMHRTPFKAHPSSIWYKEENQLTLDETISLDKALVSSVLREQVLTKESNIITTHVNACRHSSASPEKMENLDTVEGERIQTGIEINTYSLPSCTFKHTNCDMQTISFSSEHFSALEETYSVIGGTIGTPESEIMNKTDIILNKIESKIEPRDISTTCEIFSEFQDINEQTKALIYPTLTMLETHMVHNTPPSFVRQKSPDELQIDDVSSFDETREDHAQHHICYQSLEQPSLLERQDVLTVPQNEFLLYEHAGELDKDYAAVKRTLSIEQPVMDKSKCIDKISYKTNEIVAEAKFEDFLDHLMTEVAKSIIQSEKISNNFFVSTRGCTQQMFIKEISPEKWDYEPTKPFEESLSKTQATVTFPSVNFVYSRIIPKSETESNLQSEYFNFEVAYDITTGDSDAQKISVKTEEEKLTKQEASSRQMVLYATNNLEFQAQSVQNSYPNYCYVSISPQETLLLEHKRSSDKKTSFNVQSNFKELVDEHVTDMKGFETSQANLNVQTSQMILCTKTDRPILSASEKNTSFFSETYSEYLQTTSDFDRIHHVSEATFIPTFYQSTRPQVRAKVADSKLHFEMCEHTLNAEFYDKASQQTVRDDIETKALKNVLPTYAKLTDLQFHKDDIKLIYEVHPEKPRVKRSEVVNNEFCAIKEVCRAMAQITAIHKQVSLELFDSESKEDKAREQVIEGAFYQISSTPRNRFHTILSTFDFKTESLDQLLQYLEIYKLESRNVPFFEYELVKIKKRSSFVREQMLIFAKEDISGLLETQRDTSKSSVIYGQTNFASKEYRNKIAYVRMQNWIKKKSLSPEIIEPLENDYSQQKYESAPSMNVVSLESKPQKRVNLIIGKSPHESFYNIIDDKKACKADVIAVPFLLNAETRQFPSILLVSTETIPDDSSSISTYFFSPKSFSAKQDIYAFQNLAVCHKSLQIYHVTVLSLKEQKHLFSLFHQTLSGLDFHAQSVPLRSHYYCNVSISPQETLLLEHKRSSDKKTSFNVQSNFKELVDEHVTDMKGFETSQANLNVQTSQMILCTKTDRPILSASEKNTSFFSETYSEYLQTTSDFDRIHHVSEATFIPTFYQSTRPQVRAKVADSKLHFEMCEHTLNAEFYDKASQQTVRDDIETKALKNVLPTYAKLTDLQFHKDDIKLIYEVHPEKPRVKRSEVVNNEFCAIKEVCRAMAQITAIHKQVSLELFDSESKEDKAREQVIEGAFYQISSTPRNRFHTILSTFDFKTESLDQLLQYLEIYKLESRNVPFFEYELVKIKKRSSFVREQMLIFAKEDISGLLETQRDTSKSSVIYGQTNFASKEYRNKIAYVRMQNWIKKKSLSPEIIEPLENDYSQQKYESAPSMNVVSLEPKPQKRVNLIIGKSPHESFYNIIDDKKACKADVIAVPFPLNAEPRRFPSILLVSTETIPDESSSISTYFFSPQSFFAKQDIYAFKNLLVCYKSRLMCHVNTLTVFEQNHQLGVFHQTIFISKAQFELSANILNPVASKSKPKCFSQVQTYCTSLKSYTQEIPLGIFQKCYLVEVPLSNISSKHLEITFRPIFRAQAQIFRYIPGIAEEFINKLAYQYLESESESEVASSIDIDFKLHEVTKPELVKQQTTSKRVINKKEYYIEPIVETTKFENSHFEFKSLETERASRDFQSSALFVHPEIKKTFALVSPQTQEFKEEQLARISTHFAAVHAKSTNTENVLSNKQVKSASKTYVPVVSIRNDVEEIIGTLKHLDKESGKVILDTREVIIPKKEKLVSWVIPKIEHFEENITLELVDRPIPEEVMKDEVKTEFGKSKARKEEVLVNVSHEFNSEGEEDELFVEARESLDKVEIISSEINVKRPAKTRHFVNVASQKATLDLENISFSSDKTERSCAKSTVVEPTLTPVTMKSSTLQNGTSQKLDLRLENAQNLLTSIDTETCESSLICSNLTQPNKAFPKPSLIKQIDNIFHQFHAEPYITDVAKTSQCHPELITANFCKLIENLKPISHSCSMVEIKKPELVNLKQYSKLCGMISIPENIVVKLVRIEALETILYRTSLLEYLMILDRELSLKTINLDNLSMILPFPEIVTMQTGFATSSNRPITRVQTNVYFIKLEETTEKDMSYKVNQAHSSMVECVLNSATKDDQQLTHSSSQINTKTVENIVEDAISKVSRIVCRPENIVTKVSLTKKSDAVLYRVPLLNYVMLLGRVLELKTLDIDSLAVMLPAGELTLLQVAKALLGEKPINRCQTSIYLLKFESTEEKEFKFQSLSLNSLNIPCETARAAEEKRILSHSSSALYHKALEEVVLDFVDKISRIHAQAENIKVATNKVQKHDNVLSRVSPIQYVMLLEKILALNSLNIDHSSLNIQLPEIVLLETGLATSIDKPLLRTQPNLYFFQIEQVAQEKFDKSVFNIHPIQIPSGAIQNEQKKEKTAFNIDMVYDYILEEFLNEYNNTDFYSLCYKVQGIVERPLDLDKCAKLDKPLNKVQLILNFLEVEKALGYKDQSLENLLTRPSTLVEPMARREKSFKNVFKTFAVAMLAKFNYENAIELLTTPQNAIQIKRLIEESSVKERVKVNELVVRQKEEIVEKDELQKVPTVRGEHKPSNKDEKMETISNEWKVEIKSEKLVVEPSNEVRLHEEKQMIIKKPLKTEDFEESKTETERVIEKSSKTKKEDTYIFEEWQEETRLPEKENTSKYDKWSVTTKESPDVEETSMFEEWETTVKTERTIEKQIKEEKEESDDEKISLHEQWETTRKTIIEGEKQKVPLQDNHTESMFEEWEYDTKTIYLVEREQPVREREPKEEDVLREDMFEEWETTFKIPYLIEKDVTKEVDSDNESEISTQSLYEEWEFTTITKTIVEEEFPVKRDVVEIRYPQKRGTNIVLTHETMSKDVTFVEENKVFDKNQTYMRHMRPSFAEEITCTKASMGLPLILSCRIKSFSEANVEWFKDGIKLKQSPSFVMRCQGGYSTLTISKLTKRCLGRYSCRATNDSGINESSIVLDNEYFGFVKEEMFKDYNVSTEEESFDEIRKSWTKVTKDSTLLSSYTTAREPSFELEILSVTVFDGFDATLTCRVYGCPTPIIEWFFRGKKIGKSPDFVMAYKDGYCSLTISEVMQHDQGEYIIRATNEYGTSETSIHLTVLDTYELEKPSSKTARKKTIERAASEDELYSSGEETMDTWTVEEWMFYDLTNHYAVEVFMKKEQNCLQMYRYIPYDEDAFKLRISSAAAALRDTHPYRFPVIIKELPIIEVYEKKKAVLECVVEACPEPVITWFKNGKVITGNDRLKITFINNVCTLTIDEANVDDEAEYKCEARNEFGSSFTWGQIYVETVQLRWGRIKNFRIIRKKSL